MLTLRRSIKWCSLVTTAPRDEIYLHKTLQSLDLAGWSSPVVQVDNGTRGAWANFRAGLSAVIHYPWTWLLTCQDDMLIASGLREKLERDISQRVPCDIGLLSPYCPSVHQGPDPGWWRLANDDLPRKAYGACLYAWPRHSVVRLLAAPPNPNCIHRVDFWCGKFCRDANLGYYYHTPSLAQHIGDQSSIFRDGNPNTEYRQASDDWLRRTNA